jgi:hypothetical protein
MAEQELSNGRSLTEETSPNHENEPHASESQMTPFHCLQHPDNPGHVTGFELQMAAPGSKMKVTSVSHHGVPSVVRHESETEVPGSYSTRSVPSWARATASTVKFGLIGPVNTCW